MRSSMKISEVCACATVSKKSAHAQQQDLRSLRMRTSRISEVCACSAAGSQKSAHAQQCLRSLPMRNSVSDVCACATMSASLRMRSSQNLLAAEQAHRQMPTARACVLRFIIHPVTHALNNFVQRFGKLHVRAHIQCIFTILAGIQY